MILILYQISHNFNLQILMNSYTDFILKNINQKNLISTLQFLILSGNFQIMKSTNQNQTPLHYSYLMILTQCVTILIKNLKVLLNTKDTRQLLITQDLLIQLFQLPLR